MGELLATQTLLSIDSAAQKLDQHFTRNTLQILKERTHLNRNPSLL